MNILIVNCVDTTRHAYPAGHPGNWFRNAAGGDASRFAVWHATAEPEPPGNHIGGVIISGSPASAYQEEPWFPGLNRLILKCVEEGTPMLGVCFGHQLIAQTLGGKVEKNPRGREVGTLPVFLNQAGQSDPLFDGMDGAFPSFHGHGDHVTQLPPGAECLAYTPMTPVQAYRIGHLIRCIQFHPEFTVDVVKYILQRDRKTLDAQGVRIPEIEAGLRDSPIARRILANFERHFVKHHALKTT